MDTYLSLRVHLVWATKDRQPWLDPEWRSRLFACAASVIERRGGKLLCAGGTRDHIHLYLEPPGTLALSDLVNGIKTTTSKWIHDRFSHRRNFRWQHGYGAFSVITSAIRKLTTAIIPSRTSISPCCFGTACMIPRTDWTDRTPHSLWDR